MSGPIGIVGFGEAGAAVAAGLVADGAEVHAFDVRLTSEIGDALRQQAVRAGVGLVDDVAGLAGRCDTILSLVTASAAVPVARSLAPYVDDRHLVVDANSTSPALVQEVAACLGGTGASVCDVAIMAAVPPHGHRVPMLASGPGARRFAGLEAGFVVEVVAGEIGAASAIKMLRSSLVKGLEALLLEFGLAARHFGATGAVLRSVTGSLPSHDWEELASYLLVRTVGHAERRGHELEEVAAMLRTVGVEPLLADAGAQRLLRIAQLDLADRLPAGADHYERILAAIGDDEG